MPDLLDTLSFEPLTPVSYLDRAAAAHGDRTAVVDGEQRFTYAEMHERCRRLAGALAPLTNGRPVAVLAPNTHVLLEANFGVPWAGVPLVAVNTRLSAGEVSYILQHSNAAALVHDRFSTIWSTTRSPSWRTHLCGSGQAASTRAVSPTPRRRRSRPTTSERCCRSTTRPVPPGVPRE